ncbi:hypothetical protein DJ010_04505 [Nocardioides silvaticus]|uniref:Uncharacterized protein n=1 Tax=Nocardioides silvaticus TaxID=2201891 RepID=A0A316TKB8_9ACTN|nr:hypothetical protein [Nocardioides silvaticus]PWN04870.1 hypothetical protein DJ010_04505 [Nocardioides silvaticus]
MRFGRAYRRAVGLGVCGVAIGIAALAPFSERTTATLDLRGSVAGSGRTAEPVPPPTGGALAATVTWPQAAADLEPEDICIVVYDDDGLVMDGGEDVVAAIPGQPVAARWTAVGLAEGRYTLWVAQCPSAADDTRRFVEPQYLGGGADADVATWVEVTEGNHVDVGTIALHAAPLATWPEAS